MPVVRQRGSKGGHGPVSPADRGAHPTGGADDVAKKPPPAPQPPPPPPPQPQQQHQQHQPHGRAGHRARANPAAGAPACCPRPLGRALGLLFYLALAAAAAFSGWCVHHVLDEVQQVRRSHQDLARQREELGRGLQGVEQKVHSLQTTFGAFESVLRSAQHRQEATEKAVKQGESELNRISEVLQKLQNEILKDLSDGIHVVRDARERDFTSLENTVEERLTELTKSINDNIALFTDVQARSQQEISEVKAKVAGLGALEGAPGELQALREAVRELQAAAQPRAGELEALRGALGALESDVYTEVKELVSLKQEQQKSREAAETQRLALRALEDRVAPLPGQLERLEEELRQRPAPAPAGDTPQPGAWEALQRESRDLDARLQSVESGVAAAEEVSVRQARGLETLASRSEEQERRLAALQEHLESLGASPEAEAGGLASTVRSLGEAQQALAGDLEELKRSVGELPGTAGALQQVQEQVRTLLARDPAPPPDLLGRLASLDSLKASVGQVEADLKMLRTAVDSLVAYSVKIETNENNLESAKGLLEDLRSDLDRLFLKVEKIHEKV
ncbi:cytoskeleton-associated protein 4 [Sorex fumeus]|uniref:cytoskeleton-associated protein 4 n=1 Tax=Sorex fumeus TaxID=62283 RepID=UPI0024ACCFD6|nr:cytoskeleton-associated protein 4 [Sorex fumeus]